MRETLRDLAKYEPTGQQQQIEIFADHLVYAVAISSIR
jgi:hypothetical protein